MNSENLKTVAKVAGVGVAVAGIAGACGPGRGGEVPKVSVPTGGGERVSPDPKAKRAYPDVKMNPLSLQQSWDNAIFERFPSKEKVREEFSREVGQYIDTFGCPIPVGKLRFEKQNLQADSSIEPYTMVNLDSARPGSVYLDIDVLWKMHSGMNDAPRLVRDDVKQTIRHALTHACIAETGGREIKRYIFESGDVVTPVSGLMFRYKDSKSGKEKEDYVFEEAAAEVLTYALTKKYRLSYQSNNDNYKYLYKLTEEMMQKGGYRAEDLAKTVQYSDLEGFVSMVRGIKREMVDAGEIEQMIRWYRRISEAKQGGVFKAYKEVKEEMESKWEQKAGSLKIREAEGGVLRVDKTGKAADLEGGQYIVERLEETVRDYGRQIDTLDEEITRREIKMMEVGGKSHDQIDLEVRLLQAYRDRLRNFASGFEYLMVAMQSQIGKQITEQKRRELGVMT